MAGERLNKLQNKERKLSENNLSVILFLLFDPEILLPGTVLWQESEIKRYLCIKIFVKAFYVKKKDTQMSIK